MRTTKKNRRSSATKLRTKVIKDDVEIVRQIVEATGLFRVGEIDVAVELVQARLEKGKASGYEFIFAEQKGDIVGYICFGKNTVTISSFDVYWIAIEPSKQGQGTGQLLLEEAERQIAAAGGTRIYIETSHRSDYQATRGFYERCGYTPGVRARRVLCAGRQQGDVFQGDREESVTFRASRHDCSRLACFAHYPTINVASRPRSRTLKMSIHVLRARYRTLLPSLIVLPRTVAAQETKVVDKEALLRMLTGEDPRLVRQAAEAVQKSVPNDKEELAAVADAVKSALGSTRDTKAEVALRLALGKLACCRRRGRSRMGL